MKRTLSSQKREAVEEPLMRGTHSPRRQRDVERAAASQRAPMTEGGLGPWSSPPAAAE